jgi:hypothetical protein
MVNQHDNPYPSRKWTFDLWREHAGVRSASDLDNIASELGITDRDDGFAGSTVTRWFTKGIPDRSKAVKMIAVLSEAARRNRKALLNGALLREHARIFLNSDACRERYAELDEDELKWVSGGKPIPIVEGFSELRMRVFPRPPDRQNLYGRDQDLKRVLSALQSSSVSVIDAVGGNGKTTLAWHVAMLAVETGVIQKFDWTTDKRVMLDLDGFPLDTDLPPLDFNRILRSMAVRFQWYDIMAAQDADLETLCADRLATGLYLIVVDNLETIDQRDMIVDRLRGILDRRRSLSPQMSRALITSRVQVREPNCQRIELGGLDLESSKQYIFYLEQNLTGKNVISLSDGQSEKLWQVTLGNPLFIQIAVARYMRARATFDEIVSNLETGQDFNQSFRNLFSATFNELGEVTRWLAMVAAELPILTYDALRQIWLSEEESDLEYFDYVLRQLVQYRILNPIVKQIDHLEEYSIHPLVRAFLKSWDMK